MEFSILLIINKSIFWPIKEISRVFFTSGNSWLFLLSFYHHYSFQWRSVLLRASRDRLHSHSSFNRHLRWSCSERWSFSGTVIQCIRPVIGSTTRNGPIGVIRGPRGEHHPSNSMIPRRILLIHNKRKLRIFEHIIEAWEQNATVLIRMKK